jgi:hypothetical protein
MCSTLYIWKGLNEDNGMRSGRIIADVISLKAGYSEIMKNNYNRNFVTARKVAHSRVYCV